ncbi:MAG TPA: ABC transporter substrate-binding protein [Candidatus Gracilibacteria bacterium]|nr:ABC transporter substrate-binding protein [Candidatus Gracilibacteria bacterium]
MFRRVLRSYSIEEKIVSLVLVVVVFALLVQSVVDIFKRPEFFAGGGGFYTEGLISDKPVILNSVYADLGEANRDISSLIFSGLTKYDPQVGAFVEDLAELSISEDGKTYSFTLKDGVKWHDGEPLTADDVFFTFHDVIQHSDFQNPILKANFAGVEIKQLDEKSIDFVLEEPNSFFITNLNVGILPKHLLSGVPVAELPQASFNSQPVGTGPYKVDSPLEVMNDGRQRLLLTLNEHYYGQTPTIQNIRFHIYPDSQQMLAEMGTLNIVAKTPNDVLEEIQNDARFEFVNYELPQYTAVFMNMDSPVLSTDKVRIALQKAINKEGLLAEIPHKTGVDTPMMGLEQSEWLYQSNVDEANGALYDAGYRYDEADEQEEKPEEDVVEESSGADSEENTEEESASEEGSSEEETSEENTEEDQPAEEAGEPETEPVTEEAATEDVTENMEDNARYRKNSDGETLHLVMLVRMLNENPVAAAELEQTVNYLVDSWKAVGVQVEPQFEPMDIFGDRVRARNYDLLLTGESLGYNLDTYSYWHSSQSGANGLNLSNYRSFAVDALIEKSRSTFDNDEKDGIFKQLAEEISKDVPAIFLYRPTYSFATDRKVQGVQFDNWASTSDRFANIAAWCVVCE